MLKIKGNVSIEQLEELGFKYYRNEDSSYYKCYLKQIDTTSIFINNNKNISIYTCKASFDLETLYDLIKADLVEKVED